MLSFCSLQPYMHLSTKWIVLCIIYIFIAHHGSDVISDRNGHLLSVNWQENIEKYVDRLQIIEAFQLVVPHFLTTRITAQNYFGYRNFTMDALNLKVISCHATHTKICRHVCIFLHFLHGVFTQQWQWGNGGSPHRRWSSFFRSLNSFQLQEWRGRNQTRSIGRKEVVDGVQFFTCG